MDCLINIELRKDCVDAHCGTKSTTLHTKQRSSAGYRRSYRDEKNNLDLKQENLLKQHHILKLKDTRGAGIATILVE